MMVVVVGGKVLVIKETIYQFEKSVYYCNKSGFETII